jgi:hypothetical protein
MLPRQSFQVNDAKSPDPCYLSHQINDWLNCSVGRTSLHFILHQLYVLVDDLHYTTDDSGFDCSLASLLFQLQNSISMHVVIESLTSTIGLAEIAVSNVNSSCNQSSQLHLGPWTTHDQYESRVRNRPGCHPGGLLWLEFHNYVWLHSTCVNYSFLTSQIVPTSPAVPYLPFSPLSPPSMTSSNLSNPMWW